MFPFISLRAWRGASANVVDNTIPFFKNDNLNNSFAGKTTHPSERRSFYHFSALVAFLSPVGRTIISASANVVELSFPWHPIFAHFHGFIVFYHKFYTLLKQQEDIAATELEEA